LIDLTIPLSSIQKISHPDFSSIELHIKRDDLIDEMISGNKLYKLTHNLSHARNLGSDTVLTLGGAYSNHIAATASMCKINGFKSVGIIRGERPKSHNSTLSFAEDCGMHLEFISRGDYRLKDSQKSLDEIKLKYPGCFIIPEGGANLLGILGARDILDRRTTEFDYIVLAIGTGTTFAGVTKAAHANQHVIGIPILKHDNIFDDIIKVYPSFDLQPKSKWSILNQSHFGGYAKWDQSLIAFIKEFHSQTGIKLDPIYTGKTMMGLSDLIKSKKIAPGSKVLFIHTGGLQGIKGFEDRFDLRLFSS